MKKYLLFIAPLFCLMVFLFGATSVSAANYGLSETAGRTSYKTSETPTAIATKAINAVLAVVYIIFFVLVLYAGIRWMTAQGNEENVTKAKNILEAAIIGVVLISAAYAVTSFVLSKVGGGDNGYVGGNDTDIGCCMPFSAVMIEGSYDGVTDPNGCYETTNSKCKTDGRGSGGFVWFVGACSNQIRCSQYVKGEDNDSEGKICCKCGDAATDVRGTTYSKDPNAACVETCKVFGYTITQSLGYTAGECTGSGPSASSGCTDGQKNGDESDVDCGGSCAKCTAGKSCRNGSNDCQGVCYTDNKCRDLNNACCIIAKGSCTDVSCTTTEDCEQKCNNQKAASVSLSFSCIDPILNNDCRVPQHCSNNTKDGDETMKDCGGSCRSCDSYTCCRCMHYGDDKKYWYLYQTAPFNLTTQSQYVDDYCNPECKKLDTTVNRKWGRPCLKDGDFPYKSDPNSSMYSY